MMDDIIKKIKEKVINENPEFKDAEIVIKEEILEIPGEIKEKMKKIGKEIKETNQPKQGFEKKKIKTITFKRFAIAEDGAKIPIILRFTVDEKGNILKESGN
ncbi:MAG: hypothetical protein QMD06_00255 [Candidatus Altarchaeum sp.]|nr:hypothetical protein [Candidatus Altarchaeum sp.]